MKNKKTLFCWITLSLSAFVFADNENYQGQNLENGDFYGRSLENANFKNCNLQNANFDNTYLKNAVFENADIRGASFFLCSYDKPHADIYHPDNFRAEQIYSTASYRQKDLTGVDFSDNILSGWNFSGQNLTDASFEYAYLGAISSSDFYEFIEVYYPGLQKADFTDAIVNGANFGSVTREKFGFTSDQLYSTASYKNKNLSRIMLGDNNLGGWNFSGQNLQNASFCGSDISGANFAKADLRGAEMTAVSGAPVYKNTIMSDGIIRNFSMTSAGDSFSIRRYEPDGEGGAMVSAKLDTSSTISGGAVLTIESGAEFEVVSGAVLSVGAGSGIAINASLGDAAVFNVEDGAGLAFLGGSFLEVNVLGDFNGAMRFDVIDFADVARISGVENLKKGETFILKLNGETFGGEWDFILGDGALTVVLGAVPEPAACAAVFAVLALGCAALRRRASAA